MSGPGAGDADLGYQARLEQLVAETTAEFVTPDQIASASLAELALLLRCGRDPEVCNSAILAHLERPGTGPFWMMPLMLVTYGARDQLTETTREQLLRSWATVRQQRGDTENHWVLYHASLFLAAQEYADADLRWANGLTAEQNRAEALDWLLSWVHEVTRYGQTEYNPTHYLAEYAVPLLMLVLWCRDQRLATLARMMLDQLFAELATVTLGGVLRGPNARTDDTSVVERWNAMASVYSWLMFGTTYPLPGWYGWWGAALAQLAHGYQPPEVIRRIATDPPPVRRQRDRARSRRLLRGSDQDFRPVYKTQYLRPEYAVGSTTGGLSDAIQGHAWDVTWHEDDPRGKHPTLFSLHPHSSGKVLQMFFSCPPEPMALSVPYEGKPSYLEADKLVGVSPYEQVVQDLDTVVALYAISDDAPHPRVNTFISKDLEELRRTDSGWLVARGGRAFVAVRPLSDYHWAEHRTWPDAWAPDSATASGSRLLVSPGLRSGTVVHVAAAAEYETLDSFAAAVEGCPLQFGTEPLPWVRLTTPRGRTIEARFGTPPVVEGTPVDLSSWQLFEGTHLNSALGSGRTSIRHGDLERVLDFATATTTDHVHT